METLPFAYMDDRSLTDAGSSLPRALQLTSWSDQRLGLVEHMGKRQEWCRADPQAGSVEHLGEQLLLSLVLPRITWATPLLPQVPDSVVKAFFLACRSSCSWWCKGRVWADHITLHPQYATAIKCLTAASRQVARACPVLTAAVKHHADVLEMEVQSTSRGLWLRPKPGASRRPADCLCLVPVSSPLAVTARCDSPRWSIPFPPSPASNRLRDLGCCSHLHTERERLTYQYLPLSSNPRERERERVCCLHKGEALQRRGCTAELMGEKPPLRPSKPAGTRRCACACGGRGVTCPEPQAWEREREFVVAFPRRSLIEAHDQEEVKG